MSVFAVRIEGDARVVVSGELDLATAPQLASAVEALASAGAQRVVVDLAAVSFIDSTGVSGLLLEQAKLEANGAVFVLGPTSAQVESVLQMVGLAAEFVRDDNAASSPGPERLPDRPLEGRGHPDPDALGRGTRPKVDGARHGRGLVRAPRPLGVRRAPARPPAGSGRPWPPSPSAAPPPHGWSVRSTRWPRHAWWRPRRPWRRPGPQPRTRSTPRRSMRSRRGPRQARRRSSSRCCQLRSGRTLRCALVTALVSCSSKRYSNGLGRYTSVPEMVISRPASKPW